MGWELLLTAVLLSWLVIALIVAAVVGHGINVGVGTDSDSERR
jgi:hypothetical protein